MSLGWRRTIALMSILLIGLFVQCATICQVVTCDIPQKSAGCHHQESKPQKVCNELTAVLANLQLDFTLPESSIVRLPEVVAAAAPAVTISFPISPPTANYVLRI